MRHSKSAKQINMYLLSFLTPSNGINNEGFFQTGKFASLNTSCYPLNLQTLAGYFYYTIFLVNVQN